MTTKPPLRLIFVCTGNLCRSPMAEGMLRAKLGVLGLEQGAIIDSAEMHAEVGRSP
jgi:protein-tyrosine phosphatase